MTSNNKIRFLSTGIPVVLKYWQIHKGEPMKRKRRSRTAQMAGVVRAVHFAFERPVVFEDPFAGVLAGPVWGWLSRNRLLYRIGTKTIYRVFDPIRRQIIARARYAEDRLERAVAGGIDQYVIIGAGLDSFALRCKHIADPLFIYELDHPATQNAKQKRLNQLSLRLPKNHAFVPIDFETEHLGGALARSSYDPGRPAFFSWLGTVYYLSETAVFNTLAAVVGCAHPGSELVFDYAATESAMPESDPKMMTQLKRYTNRRSEPFVSAFDPAAFPGQVEQLGFELLENMSPKAQAETYFKGNDGSTAAMPGSYFAHFRVKGKA